MRYNQLLLGVFAALALTLPYLGHSLSFILNIHMRIISLALIAAYFAYGLALGSEKSAGEAEPLKNKKRGVVWVSCFLFLMTVFIYHQPLHGYILFSGDVNDSELFPNIKMGRIIVNLFPIVILAHSVSYRINDMDFKKGLVLGLYIAGGMTAAIIFKNFNVLISTNYRDYMADMPFSTIGTSMNLLLIMIAAAWRAQKSRGQFVWVEVVLVSMISIACIFILSQRTAMLIGFIILISMIFSAIKKRASLPLFMLVVAIMVIYQSTASIDLLEYFPAQVNRMFVYFDGGSDASLEGRTSAWGYGLNAFLNNPLGHGLGSFPSYFSGINYPHNVLIEALFELGLLGGVCIAVMCICSIKWMIDAVRFNVFEIEEFILLVGFLYAIKAGDFQTIGPWIFGLYLVAGKSPLAGMNDGDKFERIEMKRNTPLFQKLT